MTHKLLLKWDIARLAAALQITERDTELYFRDGRRVSFILERRLRNSFPGWTLAPSEGSGYDLIDPNGVCWEVRSVSANIYFCPSYMVGSGRRFEEGGFLRKLDRIAGYFCADITRFPEVPVYIVPAQIIYELYCAGRLGRSTTISRAAFYERVVPLLNQLSLDLKGV